VHRIELDRTVPIGFAARIDSGMNPILILTLASHYMYPSAQRLFTSNPLASLRTAFSTMSARTLDINTKLTFHNGHTMPQLGFGVYKSERGVCEKSIATALEAGYR
jgi:hypothetical protein